MSVAFLLFVLIHWEFQFTRVYMNLSLICMFAMCLFYVVDLILKG